LLVSFSFEFVGWCGVEDAREICEDEDNDCEEDSGEAAAAQIVYHSREDFREAVAVRIMNTVPYEKRDGKGRKGGAPVAQCLAVWCPVDFRGSVVG